MKRRTEGKRYSRRSVVTVDGTDAPAAVAELLARPFHSAESVIAHNVEVARTMLTERGLPAEPVVRMGQGEEAALPEYIRRKGIARDSDEGLAARVIWAAAMLAREPSGAGRDGLLFELGALAVLGRVYQADRLGQARRARAPRPGRKKVTPAVLAELEATSARKGKGAATIVAKKHGVTPAALRKARRNSR